MIRTVLFFQRIPQLLPVAGGLTPVVKQTNTISAQALSYSSIREKGSNLKNKKVRPLSPIEKRALIRVDKLLKNKSALNKLFSEDGSPKLSREEQLQKIKKACSMSLLPMTLPSEKADIIRHISNIVRMPKKDVRNYLYIRVSRLKKEKLPMYAFIKALNEKLGEKLSKKVGPELEEKVKKIIEASETEKKKKKIVSRSKPSAQGNSPAKKELNEKGQITSPVLSKKIDKKVVKAASIVNRNNVNQLGFSQAKHIALFKNEIPSLEQIRQMKRELHPAFQDSAICGLLANLPVTAKLGYILDVASLISDPVMKGAALLKIAAGREDVKDKLHLFRPVEPDYLRNAFIQNIIDKKLGTMDTAFISSLDLPEGKKEDFILQQIVSGTFTFMQCKALIHGVHNPISKEKAILFMASMEGAKRDDLQTLAMSIQSEPIKQMVFSQLGLKQEIIEEKESPVSLSYPIGDFDVEKVSVQLERFAQQNPKAQVSLQISPSADQDIPYKQLREIESDSTQDSSSKE